MKCKKCKAEIPDNSKFCNLCGAKQNTEHKKKQRGNGQGTVYKHPNGSWKAEVTLGYKMVDNKLKRIKRTKEGFKTKKLALEYLTILKNEKQVKQTNLNYLWEVYKKTKYKKLSNSKQKNYNTAFRRLEDIAFIDLNLLGIDDLQDVIDSKTSTYYPAKDIKTVLSSLYDIAVSQELTKSNLTKYLVLPELEEKSPEPFNEKEILTFWKGWNSGNKMCGYILLMIYSGMMPGELQKVSKNMINLEAHTIIGAGLKTTKRKETPIVLADALIPVVQKLMEMSSSLMLLDMGRDKFYEEYNKTVKECGCRPLKAYSCRHTTATALALLNTSPSIIQEVMRHTKFTTTQRYIHVDANPMIDAVNTIKSITP